MIFRNLKIFKRTTLADEFNKLALKYKEFRDGNIELSEFLEHRKKYMEFRSKTKDKK